MPAQRVVWNLNYPFVTPEQMTTFRHHVEVLRQDRHVEQVTASDRAHEPYSMLMRVEFREGFDRPDSQELRFADAMYRTRVTHLERVIQMMEPAPPPENPGRWRMPNIRGINAEAAIQGVMEALQAPVGDGLAHMLSCPAWVRTGETYRLKGEDEVVRIAGMHVNARSGVTLDLVDLISTSKPPRTIWLEEFVSLFEPYVVPEQAVTKTSWDHVLADDED
jgi:hypothetical protein